MSLSALRGIRHKRFKYAPETFPRVASLQDHLRKNMTDRGGYGEKCNAILKDPLVIICPSSGRFDTYDYIGNIITENLHEPSRSSYVELDHNMPVVVICILQSTVDGGLTIQDKQLLNSIKDLPVELVENLLFVMETSRISDILESLSEKIQFILKRSGTYNQVYHSMFEPKSSQLQVRISLYLEKNICYLLPLARKEIKEMRSIIEKGKHYGNTYADTLMCGPLDESKCFDILHSASVNYVSRSFDRYTRYKGKVNEVKKEIAEHICKELGKQITQTLFDKYKSELKESDTKVADILIKHVDLSDIRQPLIHLFFINIFGYIIGAFREVVEAVKIFFFRQDLNSTTFRFEIALKVHVQIMKNRNDYVQTIMGDFIHSKDKAISGTVQQMFEFETTLEKLERSNIMLNCSYHELRIVCKRSSLIQAFGYVHDEMCVFVKDVTKDTTNVQKYLSLYIKSAEKIRIRQYRKLQIKPIFVHQSGDRIHVPNINNIIHGNAHPGPRFASAGVFLSDSERKQYFVTCAHVTQGLRAPDVQVESSNGIVHTSDQIIRPTLSLDFSLVRLLNDGKLEHEEIEKGIRDKNDVHRAGKLFEIDSFVIPDNTEVFMWGAKSGLTLGKYAGTIEDKDCYPYFIIERLGNKTFAQPGDSGSLICFEQQGLTAAFILIGGDIENSDSFVGYRLADGLLETRKEIPSLKHHLNQSPKQRLEFPLCKFEGF